MVQGIASSKKVRQDVQRLLGESGPGRGSSAPSKKIALVNQIVESRADGTFLCENGNQGHLDIFAAGAIREAYAALGKASRAKFEAMPVEEMASVAVRVVAGLKEGRLADKIFAEVCKVPRHYEGCGCGGPKKKKTEAEDSSAGRSVTVGGVTFAVTPGPHGVRVSGPGGFRYLAKDMAQAERVMAQQGKKVKR